MDHTIVCSLPHTHVHTHTHTYTNAPTTQLQVLIPFTLMLPTRLFIQWH